MAARDNLTTRITCENASILRCKFGHTSRKCVAVTRSHMEAVCGHVEAICNQMSSDGTRITSISFHARANVNLTSSALVYLLETFIPQLPSINFLKLSRFAHLDFSDNRYIPQGLINLHIQGPKSATNTAEMSHMAKFVAKLINTTNQLKSFYYTYPISGHDTEMMLKALCSQSGLEKTNFPIDLSAAMSIDTGPSSSLLGNGIELSEGTPPEYDGTFLKAQI